jgi:hypothetical protein
VCWHLIFASWIVGNLSPGDGRLDKPGRVYGVPSDLDLAPFAGAKLINIGLGVANTLFVFQMKALEYATINAEGRWEAVSEGGQMTRAGSGNYQLTGTLPPTDLLGCEVKGSTLHPPTSFDLHLTNDITLVFHDDSDEFESLTIEPGTSII